MKAIVFTNARLQWPIESSMPLKAAKVNAADTALKSEPPASLERGKATLASALVDRLREEVLTGALLPGQPVRLDELRERYGVSLSPLREAVARLGTEGLLQIEEQRGVRVAPVSAANLAEVVLLRAELEPLALRDAIRHASDDWEARVTTALVMLTRQETQDDGQHRVERWERLHRQLHMTLLSTCTMPLLLHFCTMLNDRGDRYRRLFLADQAVDASVRREHAQIVEASLNRQADAACALLRQHIERSAQYVYDAIERQRLRGADRPGKA